MAPFSRRILAILLIPLALLAAIAALNLPVQGGPFDTFAAFVAAAIIVGSVYSACRGGCRLDSLQRRLVRWWGVSELLAIRRRIVPFDDIGLVTMSIARVDTDIRKARFQLHVVVLGQRYDIKDGIHDPQLADLLGRRLGTEFGCPFCSAIGAADLEPARALESAELPAAAIGGYVLSFLAIGTCCVPGVGLLLGALAMYQATRVYSLPEWLALCLSVSFLVTLITSAISAFIAWGDLAG